MPQFVGDNDPRRLAWAGMSQAFGLGRAGSRHEIRTNRIRINSSKYLHRLTSASTSGLKFFAGSATVALMNRLQELDETRRLGQARKELEPCSIVIFGATGDLTARKLIPAFYHLYK